jgi:hypothetical protein
MTDHAEAENPTIVFQEQDIVTLKIPKANHIALAATQIPC